MIARDIYISVVQRVTKPLVGSVCEWRGHEHPDTLPRHVEERHGRRVRWQSAEARIDGRRRADGQREKEL